jgi:AbrB family looped-hinge helix DNA binding protein
MCSKIILIFTNILTNLTIQIVAALAKNYNLLKKRTTTMLAATYTSDFVRVKEKFQLTLPAALRKRLNIAEGDLLEVNLVDDELRLRRKVVSPAAASGINWYTDYCKRYLVEDAQSSVAQLTEDEVNMLVKSYR